MRAMIAWLLGIGASVSIRFRGLDGGSDRCKRCDAKRLYHPTDHAFMEP